MSNWKKFDFLTISSKNPPGSLDFEFQEYVTSTSKHKLLGSRYRCLKHSESLGKIEEFININKKHGFSLEYMRFPTKEDAFINQLKILILKLKVFQNFQKKYGLLSKYDLGEILLGTLKEGFNFNSKYKKQLENDTRSFLRGETNVVYQDFPDYHLIPWLDEEPIQDAYVFRDPLPVDEKALERVKNNMYLHILDNAFIRDIDLLDALYLINKKKVNHLDEKGRTKTSFEARGDQLDIEFPENGLDYLFKKVTTNPSTSRAAGIPTIHTRNLVYTAHSNLDRVTMSNGDLYREGLDPTTWKNRLSKNEDRHFIMIDFKKSGLTTNRQVIKSVYQTAVKKYPKFRPWERYLTCLENIRVNDFPSKRGTSLGMDDNALSFFLSCAFEDWIERKPRWKDMVTGYFKGDDQILICDCDIEICKDIYRSWLKTLRKLGLLVNAKKSFIGVRGQFCEIVGLGDRIDDKIIGFSLNAIDALGCYNMVDFKIYINGLKTAHDNGRYARIFDYCVSTAIFSVEPEFCESEISVPFEMGGYFSNYSSHMNTFIVDVLENKPECDRRLFNVIGIDRPHQAWKYKKRRKLFESLFDDTSQLMRKLEYFTANPMSGPWKRTFDACLEERRKAFLGPIELIGSKIQKLIDFNDGYALPVQYLILNPRKEKIFVPKKTKKKGKLRDFAYANKRKISLAEKHYYTIDEIRAKELLISAELDNRFRINYYEKLPASTLIWSIAKSVTYSKYAVPINWLEYCNENRISVDNLWDYYSKKGINIYDYQPRFNIESQIKDLFRGPENSDCVMVDSVTGFPIKFNSYDFFVHIENRGKPEIFFSEIVRRNYYVWFDETHQIAWWGKNGRNEFTDKEARKAEMILLQIMNEQKLKDIYEIQSLRIEGKTSDVKPTHITFSDSEDEEVKIEEELSNHDSDSDYLNEYFKDNPLDSASDNEENVYANLSSSEESDPDDM
jgi:hypothetical protein